MIYIRMARIPDGVSDVGSTMGISKSTAIHQEATIYVATIFYFSSSVTASDKERYGVERNQTSFIHFSRFVENERKNIFFEILNYKMRSNRQQELNSFIWSGTNGFQV